LKRKIGSGNALSNTPDPCPRHVEAFRLFAEQAPVAVTVLDMDERFLAVSPSSAAFVNCDMDEHLGRKVVDLVPGAAAGMKAMVAALAGGVEKFTATSPIETGTGEVHWFKTESSYWRDDAGEPGGYIIFSSDVTEEIAAARRELEFLLRAVIDNIPAALSVTDVGTGRYLLVNRKVEETLGLPREAIVGKSQLELDAEAPEAQRSGIEEGMHTDSVAALREGGGILTRELTVGASRTFQLKMQLFDDGAVQNRLLIIGEDVTELREATRALEAAVAEAETANAAKSRFLANMSHEIRTPLNGVLGMAQAMARDPLPERQRQRLDVLSKSGETLLALLNDLLDLAKIEAGKVELEYVEFDVAEVVAGVCAPFQILAGQKGVALEVDAGRPGQLRRGDPTRLRQVIANLVSNAVKFTETGRIAVVVRARGDRVTFEISDTGLGMAPATLNRIFESFSQADASTTRRFGGTGLGLAICRDLVELMGGRIEASSRLGEGSRFVFSLSLPRAKPKAAAAAAETPMLRARVLAAEDNEVNRLVLTTLLEQAGVLPTVVADGAQAVEAWEREPWDVILMDVQMPVMDGVAATAVIRAREVAEGRPRTPIVALTANAMAHHAAEYAACGMDGVVSKPIQIEALFRALQAVLAPASQATPELHASA
jgi:PAS domain S-box-containing protein